MDTGNSTFPLAMASEGEPLCIVALRGGRGADRRLTELGLHIGAQIKVLQRQPGGALVVACGDCRLGLGGGLAHKVMVARVA